jgi:hypothetical protein
MYDCVMAFPEIVSDKIASYFSLNLPARMKENVMQVPATPFTMVLSDILGWCFGICVEWSLVEYGECGWRNELVQLDKTFSDGHLE